MLLPRSALGHPDNLIPANPYATPAHIVPEWYFLWVYAILRSIPNKAMGVAAIGLMFACLAALPFLQINAQSPKFRVLYEWFFWTLLADVAILTWVGAQAIEPATVMLGQIATAYLFLCLTCLVPAAVSVPVPDLSRASRRAVGAQEAKRSEAQRSVPT